MNRDFIHDLARFRRTDFHVRGGDPFCLSTAGIRMTCETRQEIVDEMLYRPAELLPVQYRGEYQKVTESASFFVNESRIAKEDFAKL